MPDSDTKISNYNDYYFRKTIMETLNLQPYQQFYLQIMTLKNSFYNDKIPELGYLGVRNYESSIYFLVRFYFLPDTYELTSNSGYLTVANYETAFSGMINGEFVPIFSIDKKKKFYIQSLDNWYFPIYNFEEEEITENGVLNQKILNIEVNIEDDSSISEEDLLSNAVVNFRYRTMKNLGLNLEEEFYLKVYKEKTTLQYQKLPKIEYLGIRDFDISIAFLLKFKFSSNSCNLVSDCKYLSLEKYETIFTKLLTGECVPVDKIDLKNRFSIQLVDEISIYNIEFEEYQDALEKARQAQLEKEEQEAASSTESSVSGSESTEPEIIIIDDITGDEGDIANTQPVDETGEGDIGNTQPVDEEDSNYDYPDFTEQDEILLSEKPGSTIGVTTEKLKLVMDNNIEVYDTDN